MLWGLVRHLTGRRSPAAMGATFVRLAGGFAVLGCVVALAFWALDLDPLDPDDDMARAVVGWSQLALAVACVWFAIGAVGGLFRRLGPRGGRDGLMIMLAVCAIAGVWSVRGVMAIADGAPAQRAFAWAALSDWGEVRVSGDVMRVRGQVRSGMLRDMRDAVRDYPGVRVVSLDSGGGSVATSGVAAEFIASRGLDTFVGAYCASACLTMFLAGERRILAEGAVLGCHQSSDAFTGESAGTSRNFRDQDVAALGKGVDLRVRWEVIRRCDAAGPEELYVPSLADLVAMGAVTHVGSSPGAAVDAQRFCARNMDVCGVELGVVR